MAWSLLIVDDHREFRRAARDLLSSDDFVVVGEASGAVEAVSQAATLRPAVVLLDVKLPDGDGFTVARALAHLGAPPLAVVLTSSHDAAVFGDRLAAAPVRGFLAKSDLSVEALAELVGRP
jgi:DNA-binding NarL/FixJ family response regulator